MQRVLFLLVFCGFFNAAWAEIPEIKIRGFGTAGFVKSDHPSYYLEEFQTYGSKLTFSPDTRIGLNLNSNFANNWNVAAQFTARADTKDYTTYLDWGFVSFQVIPELAVRAGKVTVPTWLYSQQINIGYSYLWVRPPVEVYSLLSGIKSLNGVSILSSLPLSTGIFTTEFFAGEVNFDLEGNNPAQKQTTNLDVSDAYGLDFSFSKDDYWTIHASYAKARTDARIQTNYPFGSNGLNYVAITPLSLGSTHFFSAGGKLDLKNFLFTGEFARRLISGQSLQTASAWYATAGYRIGKFTPFYSYSWLGSLRGSYNIHPSYPAVSTQKKSQFSHLLGLNIQLHDSVVLKGEYQRTKYTFMNSSHNFRANLVSLAADFIF